MASNFVNPGHTVTIPATGTVNSGDVVIIGSLIGIACGDAAIGAPLDVAMTGVYELPTATSFDIGDPVGWDADNGVAVEASTGGSEIGVAVGGSAARVKVRLNG